jgi:DNA-binding MarR family transcriptional regulator
MTVESSAVDLTPRDAAARAELVRLLRCYTATAVRFARAFAERHGLHPTDWGALLTVAKADCAGAPLTLGELGEFLGLSSGATTALVDRLERIGYVRRVRDERDRRRMILHHHEDADALLAAFSGPLDARMDALMTGYTAEELATVQRFLAEATAQLDEYRRRFTAEG